MAQRAHLYSHQTRRVVRATAELGAWWHRGKVCISATGCQSICVVQNPGGVSTGASTVAAAGGGRCAGSCGRSLASPPMLDTSLRTAVRVLPSVKQCAYPVDHVEDEVLTVLPPIDSRHLLAKLSPFLLPSLAVEHCTRCVETETTKFVCGLNRSKLAFDTDFSRLGSLPLPLAYSLSITFCSNLVANRYRPKWLAPTSVPASTRVTPPPSSPRL